MIHTTEPYISVNDYAKKCGVSVRNIRDRIRANNVIYLKLDNFYFINVVQSPPAGRINPNRPVRGKGLGLNSFEFSGLREVGYFSRGNHISEAVIYEDILLGRIDGYIIGEKIFVNSEATKKFYRKRKEPLPKASFRITFSSWKQPSQNP